MDAVRSASAAEAENLIQGAGTSLADWQTSAALARVPSMLPEQLITAGQRLVLVAPHPDDEVLGCAGILAAMHGRERDVWMIAVTDGEGSHPGSRMWSPSRLRTERPRESLRALDRLGLDVEALNWLRLGLPDSQVPEHEQVLSERLQSLVRPGDCVLTTWRLDGHCDHEATGRAAAIAASHHGARLIEMPVWAWHWAAPEDSRIPWQRARKLLLDAQTLQRKREAIHEHRSQISRDGQTPAVLEQSTLERLLQPFELVFL